MGLLLGRPNIFVVHSASKSRWLLNEWWRQTQMHLVKHSNFKSENRRRHLCITLNLTLHILGFRLDFCVPRLTFCSSRQIIFLLSFIAGKERTLHAHHSSFMVHKTSRPPGQNQSLIPLVLADLHYYANRKIMMILLTRDNTTAAA